jgi:hypothetical protein
MFYSYLLGWSKINKFYYGIRYSKYSKLDDLHTKKYRTSSKYVKELYDAKIFPDIIQIRKIAKTREQIFNWETKVLRRMKVLTDDRFLNRWENNMVPKTHEYKQLHSCEARAKNNKVLIKKYGARGSASPIIKEKVFKTNNERYGTYHTLDIDIVKNEREKSCIEKFGDKNPYKNPEKMKEIMIERYGVSNMMKA